MIDNIAAPAGTPYWIAHNGGKIVHFGHLKAGEVLATGQPILEWFASEEAQMARLEDFGIVINEDAP